jgi:hypothetical protein
MFAKPLSALARVVSGVDQAPEQGVKGRLLLQVRAVRVKKDADGQLRQQRTRE